MGLAAAATLGLAGSASAATVAWTTNGGGLYSDAANWGGNAPPQAADDVADFSTLDLAADATVTMDLSPTLGQIIFGDTDAATAAGWLLDTGSLTLATTTASGPTITVNALGTGEVARINSGIFGSQGLTKAGAGTLLLAGANGYSGGTIINGGTLQVGLGQAVADDVATLGSGPITNNGTLDVFKTTDLGIADNISGTGNLVKRGAANLTLSGNNTYGGTTTINAGAITFGTSGAVTGLAANSITVNSGGSVAYNGGSLADAAFASRIAGASTGTLALGGADAATNFDFTTGSLAALGNMSLGTTAASNVTYTGTVTPAGGVYRFGGGGGTLTLPNAITTGSMVLGGGTGNTGTVVITADNTYAGTTNIVAGTVNVGNATATGSLGTGDITIASGATLLHNRTANLTMANNISGGGNLVVRSSGVASTLTLTGNVEVNGLFVDRTNNGGNSIVEVNGGNFVANGLSRVQGGNGPGQFILRAGTATFNGSLLNDNNDGHQIRVAGGVFTANDIGIYRSGGTTNPSFGGGFFVTGGTANVGTLTLGVPTANSWGTASLEGGTTNVSGALTIGRTSNGGRGGALRVQNTGDVVPVLNVTDTVDGIIMGRARGTTAESQTSRVTFSGGISTVEKFTVGYDSFVTGGNAQMNVSNVGQLYVGSGGFVKNSPAGHTAVLNLSGGTLAAKADWALAEGIQVNVTGTAAVIKAADASDNPFNITINGHLTGTGTLTKTGGGTLSLYGNNINTGPTIVQAGVLQGTGASLRGSITNNATVRFNQPDSTSGRTFGGAISGPGVVEKVGPGTTVLPGGQTYTGATTINEGVLSFAGTHASTSGVTVNNGGGIGVTGGATIPSLTLGASSGDALTLLSNDGLGVQTLTVANTGGLIANGLTTIDLGSAGLTSGTHVLIDYSGTIGGGGFSASTFTLGTLPSRTMATLANNAANTAIEVTISSDGPRWDGNINGDWDINATANWKGATSGASLKYVDGDQVLFNEAAAGTTSVNIAATVQPSLVTVSGGKDYTFGGAGHIAGATSLIKQGPGKLTLSGAAHAYTGGTFVQGGTLEMTNANLLPAGQRVVVSGGTLDMNFWTNDVSGALVLSGGTLTKGTINKTGDDYDFRSGTVTDTVGLAGTAGLTKSGPGTVVLLGTFHTYTGTTTVSEGTLQLGDGVALGAVPNNGNINNNGTVAFNNASDQVYSGSILGVAGNVVKDGAGLLVLTNANEGNAVVNAGTVRLVGVAGGSVNSRLGRGGSITMNAGTTLETEGENALGLNSATLPANVILNTGSTLRFLPGSNTSVYDAVLNGGTMVADADYGGTVSIRGDIDAGGGAVSTINVPSIGMSNAVDFDVSGGATLNVNAELTGGTSMAKSGAGVMNVTVPMTHTGATSVAGGRLVLHASHLVPASVNAINDGVLELASDGTSSRVIKTGALTITGTAKVDIRDNKLITTTPVGTATGGVYAEGSVHRMVQTAYQESAWGGPGLMTSMDDAKTGLTTVAIATGEQIGVSSFGGQQVAPTDTIAFYTYGGDTNFDGKLDADDYGTIDFNVLLPGPIDGYYNGDFNYDGVVNADDYGVIDFNILAQTTPFPTGGASAASSSSAGLAGVTAVPEPASLSVLGLGAASLLGRRRRRNQ